MKKIILIAISVITTQIVLAQLQNPKLVKTACNNKYVANTYPTEYENKALALNAINTIKGAFKTGPALVDSMEVIVKGGTLLFKCGTCTGIDTLTGFKCTTTVAPTFLVKVTGAVLTFTNNTPAVANATSPSKPAPYSFTLNMGGSKNLTTNVDYLMINLDFTNLPAKNQKGCKEYVQVIYALKIYYNNGCIALNTYEYNAKRP
jgi:hypothetical protein